MLRLHCSVEQARSADPGSVHRLRLQVKKVRYCLALAQTCSRERPVDPVTISALARAQNQLGKWNDRLQGAARGTTKFTIPRGPLRDLLRDLARVVAVERAG